MNFSIVDTINQLTFDESYNAKVFWLLLNSKLINWYSYRFIFAKAIRTMHFDNSITNRIPIPIKFNQKIFIDKADLMLALNKELIKQSQKFQRIIQRKFEIETLPKKLQDWYLLSFAGFVKELARLKIKLSLSQEAEWEDYFIQEARKMLDIKSEINATDKAIDKMVYELYGLTAEEIEIVERS